MELVKEQLLRPLDRVQWPQKPHPQSERKSTKGNLLEKKSLRFGAKRLQPRLFLVKQPHSLTYMRLFNRKRKEPSERPPAASSLKTH